MKVWRICRERHLATAFSGEGARVAGARWNSPGTPLAYTSWCLSLAALEMFVNLDPEEKPDDLVWISAEVPVDAEWEQREELLSMLPAGWRLRADREARMFGDDWIESKRSYGLVVPSVVTEGEWNILLNPMHRDAGKLRIVERKPFRFDERMFRA
jgi:RES domain-containing protein